MDHFQSKMNLSTDWNIRLTSPFLIPNFFDEYVFLHSALQIFFQGD